jgi:hypothetical protein
MITKDDLTKFILQVAEGLYSRDDWQKIAVNHYEDEKMEDARREMVRYVLGYPAPDGEEQLPIKEHLMKIAAKLKT